MNISLHLAKQRQMLNCNICLDPNTDHFSIRCNNPAFGPSRVASFADQNVPTGHSHPSIEPVRLFTHLKFGNKIKSFRPPRPLIIRFPRRDWFRLALFFLRDTSEGTSYSRWCVFISALLFKTMHERGEQQIEKSRI